MGQGTSRHTMREVLWEEKNLAEVQYWRSAGRPSAAEIIQSSS